MKGVHQSVEESRIYEVSPIANVYSHGLYDVFEVGGVEATERANVLWFEGSRQPECVLNDGLDHRDIMLDLEQQVGGGAAVLWAYVGVC